MADEIAFSLITTVLNEKRSIIPLLDSLANQTLKPREIIIADAGSDDGTVTAIENWKKLHEKHRDLKISVLKCPGANRSQGRNKAIKDAEFEHIAVTDAGCEADNNWLEELAGSFKAGSYVESVAGFYLPVALDVWQKCFALYTAVSPASFNPQTYLPSSRSIAFTKKAWMKAGRYPEHLDTCEDLMFARHLKRRTVMKVNHEAIVHWHIPDSIWGFYKQIQGYAMGDVMAGYEPHIWKIITVFLRYILFVIYPLLFVAYFFYPAIKHWGATYRDGSFFILPLVQVAADLGVMTGALKAVWHKLSQTENKVSVKTDS